MKTIKALFVITTILMVSGYTFASTKGPGGSTDSKNIREKIATAVELAELKGKGEVTLTFGVNDKKYLQIIKIESTDNQLSADVKKALEDLKFAQELKGVYRIKLMVNELDKEQKYSIVRSQLYEAIDVSEVASSGNVNVKLRVINPTTVQVVKAESNNKYLAQIVKKNLEEQKYSVPQNLCGEYYITVLFR